MTFEMSAGLARELEIRSTRKDELLQYLGSSASLDSWTQGSNKNIVAEQTRRITRFIPPKGRVLDVGFGVGFSSMELGRLGYSVTGVEPSSVNIEIASRATRAISFDGSFYANKWVTKRRARGDNIWPHRSVPKRTVQSTSYVCRCVNFRIAALRRDGIIARGAGL